MHKRIQFLESVLMCFHSSIALHDYLHYGVLQTVVECFAILLGSNSIGSCSQEVCGDLYRLWVGKEQEPQSNDNKVSAPPHFLSINGSEIITRTIQCQLLDLTLILALLSQTKNEGLLLVIDLRSHPQVFTHLPAMPNGLSGAFLNRERAT